ncbi:MAG TPA: Phenylacetic acid catabolic protein [Candidatus Kryptonia bacterium]
MTDTNPLSYRNPSRLANSERENRMLEKFRKGESIETTDEMSDDYYLNLVNLMLQQADSELAGAFGYVPWIMQAPTTEEKLAVANIVKDEVRHARAMYRLLEDIGIDVDSHVSKHDYTLRIETKGDDLKDRRAADDRRVNIFYYPIDSWADFVMFQFCMDRGAGHQLEDVKKSTYGPWKREIERIFKEEMMHVNHGDYWVKKMALDKPTRAEIQSALERWYPRTMNIFGKPKTNRNQVYRKYGLKQRDNDDVRKAFSEEVRLKCGEWGLHLPNWKAEWERIEEDGVISG